MCQQSTSAAKSGIPDGRGCQHKNGAGDFYCVHGKRILDLTVGLAGFVLASPILLLCMVLVRLTSSGPVFFRQVRLGKAGRPFRVFKFRTMRQGSEFLGAAVTVSGDARVTSVGSVLRKTKLDELPQLVNVLCGDMSIVGPRPRVPELVNPDNFDEQALLVLRPGLTSYASVFHRMEELYCRQQDDPQKAYLGLQKQKGNLDLHYLRNQSLLLDLKLILLTALLVFFPGKGEARGFRLGGMYVRPYGGAAQMVLDLLIFALAVWLAYWLRFEGEVPLFNGYQMAAFVVLIPAIRLVSNRAFGVYDMIWRYVSLVDASIYALSLMVVTGMLVTLRLLLPSDVPTAHVFQLPLSVIAMEYFLSLGGGLGLRALRRALYVLNHRYQPFPMANRARVLILGAGLSGVGVALELGRYPHLDLVGFVDDDLTKQNRLIAGHRVFGTSADLPDLFQQKGISDLIICAHSMRPEVLEKIREICRAYGIKLHVIPTMEEILM